MKRAVGTWWGRWRIGQVGYWVAGIMGLACGDSGAGPVQFVDVTRSLGINFVHYNGLSEEKRLP